MSNAIDARLTTALTQFTSDTDNTPGVVDLQEARSLLNDANKINDENSWFFGLWRSHQGEKDLGKLLSENGAKFDPLAKSMVDEFVKTGKATDNRLVNQFQAFTAAGNRTPGVIDQAEALQMVKTAKAINNEGNWFFGLFKGTQGNKDLSHMLSTLDAKFDGDAKKVAKEFIQTGRVTGLVAEWKSAKPTWHCHWFPMKETNANGGDAKNNLFAPNGALDKYDKAFGTKSRQHELDNNFRPHDSEAKDANWAGHCNYSAEVAAMLEEPKKSVTYKGQTFTPRDIEGLLVKVSSSLASRFDFEGNRYNRESDDIRDPKPHDFLEKVIKGWGSESANPIPFVLDIDRAEAVWNYPYDQGKVYASTEAPDGVDVSDVPESDGVTFYQAEMKGTGFEGQARRYQFWIDYDKDGSVNASGWLEGDDKKINPDFAWRPHPVGDLSDKKNWVSRPHRQNNPEVRAEDVYEIYIRSIS